MQNSRIYIFCETFLIALFSNLQEAKICDEINKDVWKSPLVHKKGKSIQSICIDWVHCQALQMEFKPFSCSLHGI